MVHISLRIFCSYGSWSTFGIFIVPHLLWHRASVLGFHLKDPLPPEGLSIYSKLNTHEPGDKRSLGKTHLAIILTDRNKLGVINHGFFLFIIFFGGGGNGVNPLDTNPRHNWGSTYVKGLNYHFLENKSLYFYHTDSTTQNFF